MELSDTNVDQTAVFLEDHLGPQRQDLYKVIPVTVIYVIIFATGLVGNISTCVVIARNRYMRTSTNYCLFNLAISDLLVLLLGLPQETYSFWSAYPWLLGEPFCMFRTMAAETSTYASILTLTAFTVERYVIICHPVKARSVTRVRRVAGVILVIWIVSGICSVPIVLQYGVVYLKDVNGVKISASATCSIRENEPVMAHAFEISTFLFFIAPITIMSVLYGLIGVAIRRSTAFAKNGTAVSTRFRRWGGCGRGAAGGGGGVWGDCGGRRMGSDVKAQQQARARVAVTKMLVAVVVAFFICWAPFHTQRLISIYSTSPSTPPLINIVPSPPSTHSPHRDFFYFHNHTFTSYANTSSSAMQSSYLHTMFVTPLIPYAPPSITSTALKLQDRSDSRPSPPPMEFIFHNTIIQQFKDNVSLVKRPNELESVKAPKYENSNENSMDLFFFQPDSTVTSDTADSTVTDSPSSRSGVGSVILFYISGILYYVSAVINPILYSTMSMKFRRAFKNTICTTRNCCCECRLAANGVNQHQPRTGAGGKKPVAAYYFHVRPDSAGKIASGKALNSSASLIGSATQKNNNDKELIFMGPLRSSKASSRGLNYVLDVQGLNNKDGGVDMRSANSILMTTVYGDLDKHIPRQYMTTSKENKLKYLTPTYNYNEVERGIICSRRQRNRETVSEGSENGGVRHRTSGDRLLGNGELVKTQCSLEQKSSDRCNNGSALLAHTMKKRSDTNDRIDRVVTSPFVDDVIRCYHSHLALLRSERTTL